MRTPIWRPLVGEALKRLLSSPFSWWLILFVIAQVVFLWVSGNPSILPSGWHLPLEDVMGAQTGFFLCSVHMLLLVNTIAFLAHVTPLVSSVQHLPGLPLLERKDSEHSYEAFLGYLIVSVFMSGAVALLVGLATLGVIPKEEYFHGIIDISKYVSGLIYWFFLLADFCCLDIVKKILRHEPQSSCLNRAKFEELDQTLQRYVVAVDLPGFVGLLMIIFCSHALFPGLVPEWYWEGFIAGAVGFHITFSQTALAFISVLDP